MIRLLYIFPGPVPPGSDPKRDRFSFLSEIAEGEILLPVWWKSAPDASAFLRPTYPVHRVGHFRYHFLSTYRYPTTLRSVAKLWFYIRKGLELHREKKLDVIITYGTNGPGVAGVVLKWLTGAKLVVEIPGVPEDAFRYSAPKAPILLRSKRIGAGFLLRLSLTAADFVKLLYPLQLNKYPRFGYKKAAAFHDFVPVRSVHSQGQNEKVVLTVGHPWYTKGVDILIRAFRLISTEYPDWKLKLMGHYPDRAFLNELAEGCGQIEFVQPRLTAFDEMARCSVYVLASRTEAMGRVLLEAMATRKPILASAVGGVPHYIKDNENGLLFQSENVNDLAAKLSLLMSNPDLRDRLAKRGYDTVMSDFDERAYAEAFLSMLQDVVNINADEEKVAHETLISAGTHADK